MFSGGPLSSDSARARWSRSFVLAGSGFGVGLLVAGLVVAGLRLAVRGLLPARIRPRPRPQRRFRHRRRRLAVIGRACRRAWLAPVAVAAVLVVRVGVALVARFLGQQGLPVGDGDLVIIGVDLAEGEEAVAVAAIVDERRLKRRFDPDDLGEIDVPAKLFLVGGFEIELFDSVPANHHDPGLFRVGGVDKHLVGHEELSMAPPPRVGRFCPGSGANEACLGTRARSGRHWNGRDGEPSAVGAVIRRRLRL